LNKNDVRILIDDISDNSKPPLKNFYEISIIIGTSISQGKQKEFKDLIFTGKYVNGLKKVLADRTINKDKYMENMFEEFNKNLQKVIELMKKIVEDSDEMEKKYFNEKYFLMNHESIVNTMELIEDLSLCKEYFNNNPNAVPGLSFRHSS